MLHRLAVVTSGATLLLIMGGGIVTSTGAGLAVPDWPTTFGYNLFLFPRSRMVGAVLIEHAHRLLGAGVGILTVALAIATWVGRRERRLRVLAVTAGALVCVQGLLGGLRVVLRQDALAIVHGCLAQGYFALTATLATLTGSEWNRVGPVMNATGPGWVAGLAAGVAALLCGQIVLGVLTTHAGWLAAHLGGAAVAVVGTGALVTTVHGRAGAAAPIRWRGRLIGGLLVLQVGLGLGAFLARFTALAVPGGDLAVVGLLVAHRAVSALLLGLVVTLAMHAWRLGRAGIATGQNRAASLEPSDGRVAAAS
jgi:cytochrome c oxidase assembly protein subunit 15